MIGGLGTGGMFQVVTSGLVTADSRNFHLPHSLSSPGSTHITLCLWRMILCF